MNVQVLYRFPVSALQRRLPRSWLVQEGSGGLLAVAYVSDRVPTTPFSCSLSWHLFDMATRSLVKEGRAPHLLTDIDVLHLAYDAPIATWIVGSLEFRDDTSSFHAVVRLLREDENGQAVLSAPIFDDPANEMAPIGPIYALQASGKRCTLLYSKPDLDCVSTPEICLGQIDLTTGHVEHSIKDGADSALTCHQEDSALLLSLVPRMEEAAQEGQAGFTGVTHYWGFSVTGYSRDFHTENWYHDLDLHLPAGRSPVLQGNSDFEWLGINAAAIPGPFLTETGQQTYIVGITMMDVFDLPDGYGHTSEEASWITHHVETLVCIDTHGEVVQTCTNAIGLRVHLCRVQATVVGVDLLKGQWRLWNWEPLVGPPLQTRIELDRGVLCAHVVAETGREAQNARHFWLIEEYSDQVKIARRDASTLAEVTPAVSLAGVHLLAPQNGSRSLDWHTAIEAMIYHDTLLLLAVDAHEQLVLYQVK